MAAFAFFGTQPTRCQLVNSPFSGFTETGKIREVSRGDTVSSDGSPGGCNVLGAWTCSESYSQLFECIIGTGHRPMFINREENSLLSFRPRFGLVISCFSSCFEAKVFEDFFRHGLRWKLSRNSFICKSHFIGAICV